MRIGNENEPRIHTHTQMSNEAVTAPTHYVIDSATWNELHKTIQEGTDIHGDEFADKIKAHLSKASPASPQNEVLKKLIEALTQAKNEGGFSASLYDSGYVDALNDMIGALENDSNVDLSDDDSSLSSDDDPSDY